MIAKQNEEKNYKNSEQVIVNNINYICTAEIEDIEASHSVAYLDIKEMDSNQHLCIDIICAGIVMPDRFFHSMIESIKPHLSSLKELHSYINKNPKTYIGVTSVNWDICEIKPLI